MSIQSLGLALGLARRSPLPAFGISIGGEIVTITQQPVTIGG